MTTTIEHRTVQANGITFHVATSGPSDGPPVLCLHGFPEGWMSWRPVMRQLPEARLYAPDLRGYGETPGRHEQRARRRLPVDLRPLPGIGHFVSLEAPAKLTREIRRLLEAPTA